MCPLLSDEKLRELTEKYHFLQESDIVPLLIRFLWSLRHLQKDLEELPINRKDRITEQAKSMDCAIAFEILSNLDDYSSV
jgi:Asp-tRNA(Asn)/Glu-tRNA(Gln) amidotransferase B subunit